MLILERLRSSKLSNFCLVKGKIIPATNYFFPSEFCTGKKYKKNIH